MKKIKLLSTAIVTLILSVGFATALKAQSFVEFKATNQSKVSISGTSSLHDWDMKLSSIDCKVMGEKTNQNTILLKDIVFTAKVSDLKSNESSIMDNKAYKAMKEDQFPNISFSGNEVILPLNNDSFKGTVDGWLTIAGKKNPVKININGNSENGAISIEGEYPLSMSSYGIKPPTAFFGTLKTGDQIKIHFNILLQNNSNISSIK
ncbi:MAG: YceI family protein [Bacteroidales bacterium]|nr:YceI family protein [Bacteroidales bacterium]